MKRTAFVTGAGQGIGLAIAKRLDSAGYNVIVADIGFENAKRAAASLQSAEAVRLDVCSIPSIEEALAEGAKKFGSVSYTHLDVYKRQVIQRGNFPLCIFKIRLFPHQYDSPPGAQNGAEDPRARRTIPLGRES